MTDKQLVRCPDWGKCGIIDCGHYDSHPASASCPQASPPDFRNGCPACQPVEAKPAPKKELPNMMLIRENGDLMDFTDFKVGEKLMNIEPVSPEPFGLLTIVSEWACGCSCYSSEYWGQAGKQIEAKHLEIVKAIKAELDKELSGEIWAKVEAIFAKHLKEE